MVSNLAPRYKFYFSNLTKVKYFSLTILSTHISFTSQKLVDHHIKFLSTFLMLEITAQLFFTEPIEGSWLNLEV